METLTGMNLIAKAKPFAETEVAAEERFIEYKDHTEKEKNSRLLVVLPGLDTNSKSQARTLQNLVRQIAPELVFDALSGKYAESQVFNYDRAAAELIDQLSQLEDKNKEIILFASSLGGITAIRFLQLLNKSDKKLNIKAVCLLMPCINEDSIKAHIIHLLKKLPRKLSLPGLALAYEVKTILCRLLGVSYLPGASLEAKYARLTAIPAFNQEKIKSGIPLYAFFSPNDRYINKQNVVAVLHEIAPESPLEIVDVSATGINYHDFQPKEWFEAAKKHFLPIFQEAWGKK